MDPVQLVKLHSLMDLLASIGGPEIIIGLIDGPIAISHPSFKNSRIKTTKEKEFSVCSTADSVACAHGTFVTGILSGQRNSPAPAICPECTIVLRPIFSVRSESSRDVAFPSALPSELSQAIVETVSSGARIINLSLGLDRSSLVLYRELEDAYDFARQKGVIIVAASGYQGNIGNTALLHNKWVIPVAACDENGRLSPMSNYGPSIRNRGLMAPGIDIMSTSPGGRYTKLSGTSFAAPFVTGTIALFSIH